MNEQQNNQMPPVEQAPPQPTYQEEQPQSQEPEAKSGGMGPLIGVIIIVLLLVFGGLYFWGMQLNSEDALDPTYNDDIATPNDEPDQIENDLDTFDTDAFEAQLEKDLEAIEAEL